MRYPIAHDSVLLRQSLLLTGFADLRNVPLVVEKGIIVVRCRPVINGRLETHLKVRCAHRMGISNAAAIRLI